MRHGGTAAAPIVVRSYPGETATLVGRLRLAEVRITPSSPIWTWSASNMATSAQGCVASPTVDANHTTWIRDDVTNDDVDTICFLLGDSGGVYGTADYTTIEDDRIHDCGALPATNYDHGIYVEESYGSRILDNLIIRQRRSRHPALPAGDQHADPWQRDRPKRGGGSTRGPTVRNHRTTTSSRTTSSRTRTCSTTCCRRTVPATRSGPATWCVTTALAVVPTTTPPIREASGSTTPAASRSRGTCWQSLRFCRSGAGGFRAGFETAGAPASSASRRPPKAT